MDMKLELVPVPVSDVDTEESLTLASAGRTVSPVRYPESIYI